MAKFVGLTENEKTLLSALVEHKQLTRAAKALGISVQLASARKHRALKKYLMSKEVVREYEVYVANAPTILESGS